MYINFLVYIDCIYKTEELYTNNIFNQAPQEIKMFK